MSSLSLPNHRLLKGAGQHGVHVPDGTGGHRDALRAVRLVHTLFAGEGQAEDLAGTHWRLAVAHPPVAVLALAATETQLGVEAVQGGRVEPADGQDAQGGLDLQVDTPPVVGGRSWRHGLDRLTPLQPAVDQLADLDAMGLLVAAGGNLGEQLGLQRWWAARQAPKVTSACSLRCSSGPQTRPRRRRPGRQQGTARMVTAVLPPPRYRRLGVMPVVLPSIPSIGEVGADAVAIKPSEGGEWFSPGGG